MLYLKQPVQIGKVRIPDRLVLPPLHTGKAREGRVTPEQTAGYVRRSAGGAVGLLIMEYCYIARQGQSVKTQVSLAEDGVVESHRALVEAVHREGSRILCQLNHAGLRAPADGTGTEAGAPSAVPDIDAKPGARLPRALEIEEIGAIEDAFATAAHRAQAAGDDGGEIHGAHGYLYNQFFSPLLNHRYDAYGQDSVADRARIFTETIGKIRRDVGPDFLIAVRFGGCDYMEGGSTLADCAAGAKLLKEAGADLLDISGGLCGPYLFGNTTPGYFREASRAARDATGLPTILTGGVTEPDQAEALLREGCADLIGVGRALLKDPDWGRRVPADG